MTQAASLVFAWRSAHSSGFFVRGSLALGACFGLFVCGGLVLVPRVGITAPFCLTLRSSGTRLIVAVLKVCYFSSFGGFVNCP
jgi:hypothetical protein